MTRRRSKSRPQDAREIDHEMRAYCQGVWERWRLAEIEAGTWAINYEDRNPEAQAAAEIETKAKRK